MRDLPVRLVAAAGLVAARAPLVDAQGTPDHARADRLFTEGRALAKAHHYAEACERFAASDTLERTFGTAVNLGDCASRDGHPGRAWQLYDVAARMAERDGAHELAKFARGRATALAPQLCTVVVTIADPTPRMTVRIGDRDEPPAPEIRALVEPGDIEVVVAAADAPPLRRTLHGAAGSVVTLDVPTRTPRSSAPHAAPPIPGFVVIDRFDGRSRAGFDFTYLRATEPDLEDRPTSLRFEVHARYVDPSSGFGGYLQVPLAYTHHSDILGDEFTATSVGDIELGGLLVRTLSARDITLVVHAGATLPTGETGNNEQSAANLASLVALPQLYDAVPRGISAMLGASASLRNDKLFAHLHLGGDWNLASHDPSGAGAAIHYDAGAGIDLGSLAVMLELENAWLTKDRSGLHAIALSARAELAPTSLYTAIIAPLGSGVSSLVDLAVVIGVELTLR
ncbi:MAG TPA: hypothetical protein VGD80_22135 [Kofleriaceae bacterium]